MNSKKQHLIVWVVALLLPTTLSLVPHPKYIQVIEIELGYDSGIAVRKDGATFHGGWVIGNEFPKVFEFRGGILPETPKELEEELFYPTLLPRTEVEFLKGNHQREDRIVALLEIRSSQNSADAQNILHALRTYYHKYIRPTNDTIEGIIYRLDHEIEQLEQREQRKFVRDQIVEKKALRAEIVARFPFSGNRARRVFQLRDYGFRYAVSSLFPISGEFRSSKSNQ